MMINNRVKKIIICFLLFFELFFINNIHFIYAEENSSTIYSDNTWAEFSKNNVIGSEKNIEVHIKTQEDLNNYLKRTGNNLSGDLIWLDNVENITFPEGSYIFTEKTEIYCPEAKGDVDFNGSYFLIGKKGLVRMSMIQNQHNRTFKNLNVIGSSHFEVGDNGQGDYNNNYGISRSISGFFLQALKASNARFKNLEFNNAHLAHYHIFDIIGSNNFVFENIVERGYLEDLSEEDFLIIYNTTKKDSRHLFYSEFIQLDYAYKKGLSIDKDNHLSNEFKNNYFNEEEFLDNTTTTDTTINNVRLVGYYGPTGEAIINNTNEKVSKPYPSGLGSHGEPKNPHKGIVIKNNYFENYIHLSNISRPSYSPIHFTITSGTQITFSNNTFINCFNNYKKDPSYSSDYLMDFDPVKRDVSKTILYFNNKKIKSYDGYHPEEPFYENYIYVSSSYDYSSKVLSRNYREPLNKVIIKNNDVFENNDSGNSNNSYSLVSSDVTSKTTESLPNGDSITVKHIKNTYRQNSNVVDETNIDNNSNDQTANNPYTGNKIIFVSLFLIFVLFVLIFTKKMYQ